jgi:hypothetical protein
MPAVALAAAVGGNSMDEDGQYSSATTDIECSNSQRNASKG